MFFYLVITNFSCLIVMLLYLFLVMTLSLSKLFCTKIPPKKFIILFITDL